MADSCTIYCKVNDLARFSRLLSARFPGFDRSVAPEFSQPLVVRGKGGSLRLTPKWFRAGGDEFCRLILSTCTHIEGLPTSDAAGKTRLASHVEMCELAIGIVAEPDFSVDERYEPAVLEIAKSLDGIIFNGQHFLDANGNEMLVS